MLVLEDINEIDIKNKCFSLLKAELNIKKLNKHADNTAGLGQ